ncbi:carboxy-terminal protease [Aquisphaera giovannonii]|uniref:Carboxy-terminal protease n=1 Tax=Aquisphaera giovannonii TaxID=406548 RepID=A0A5B9WE36_9BACT|nr:S41 family peptidase [Aquisphaera giovannonii]QEH38842.1 carboxy-terminal protease [Aquisphaera giovannonii]
MVRPRTNAPSALAFALALALASWHPGAVHAQGPPPDQPDLKIDAKARGEVIDALVAALDKEYVFPETAAKMAKDLRRRLEAKEYEGIAGAKEFARTLTDHLRAISKDKHLGVDYSYEAVPVSPPGAPSGPPPEERERMKQFAARVNYGFEKVERLEGNVGYLNLRGFMPPEIAGETAAAAMTFLGHSDALIIDLRQNNGGEPAMVAFLTSYLFDGEPVHVNDLYFRPEDRTQQWWTLSYVPGKKLGKDKPVFVLTSRQSFSAAEEFAYNLKNLKRARIVGETTGGGAHPGEMRRLAEHFAAFIPNGRAINPISRTNWEGTGVSPDIESPAEHALKAAHVAALEAIFQADPQPQDRMRADHFRKAIDRLRRELDDARSKPAAKPEPH